MRNLRQHSVWVFLMFFAAGSSVLASSVLAQQVNASVDGSVRSTSAGSGDSVSSTVNASVAGVTGVATESRGRIGHAVSVHTSPSFGSVGAFGGGEKTLTGSAAHLPSANLPTANLPAAAQSEMFASQSRPEGMGAGATSLPQPSEPKQDNSAYSQNLSSLGKYAVLGQFPDSTRGLGWPSPPESYSPYRIGFFVRPLLWKPDFSSEEHLKISYLVSLAPKNSLKRKLSKARKERNKLTALQRLTQELQDNNTGLRPNQLLNPLENQDASPLSDQPDQQQ